MILTTRRMPAAERRWQAFMPSWLVPPPSSLGTLGRAPRTSDEALRHTTVWACISLISELLGSLPVDVFRDGPNGREEVPPDPNGIVLKPSAEVDAESWRTQFVASLLSHGNAYGLITETNAQGWPATIEWLDPSLVTPRRGASGRLEFLTPGRVLTRSDLVHVPGLTVPGNPIGMSPIAHFAQTIGVGLSAQEFGARWFADGAHPSSMVTSDQVLTPEQAQNIKDRIRSMIQGREPAVFGSGLKYTPVSVPANESQFLETIGANAATIAGQIYRVPPEMLGIATPSGGTVTYANREQRAIDFLTFTLLPWVRRFESMLSKQLPRGQYARLNTGALLAVDKKTAFEVAAIAQQNGFQSVNETRRIFDRPPIGPDGDVFAPIIPASPSPIATK